MGYRLLGNTNRGEIGEEFVRRYLRDAGMEISHGNRTEEIDLVVEGYSAEIKTASLGANGTFQFNHIRLDRDYEFLICIGICPDEIVFNMWTGEDVHSESAGHFSQNGSRSSGHLQAHEAAWRHEADRRVYFGCPIFVGPLANCGLSCARIDGSPGRANDSSIMVPGRKRRIQRPRERQEDWHDTRAAPGREIPPSPRSAQAPSEAALTVNTA